MNSTIRSTKNMLKEYKMSIDDLPIYQFNMLQYYIEQELYAEATSYWKHLLAITRRQERINRGIEDEGVWK
jgi:hypothetical protein